MAGVFAEGLYVRNAAPPFGFWGAASVTGTTKVTPSTAVSRRVRLHLLDNGAIVAEQWSDTAGNYAFNYIAPGTYYVVAFDHTGSYGAVIADNIVIL